jgi:hypothetical protein
VIELEDGTELVDTVELLYVAEFTDVSKEIVCVVDIEVDAGVNADDVVLKKARGS